MNLNDKFWIGEERINIACARYFDSEGEGRVSEIQIFESKEEASDWLLKGNSCQDREIYETSLSELLVSFIRKRYK